LKRLPIILCLLFSLAASAFDTDAWVEKNAAMAREAERMKAAYETYSARIDKPAENVTIPLETFESGEVKTVIYAKFGQFFQPEGYTWAKDITAEQYDEDGSLDMRLEADSCLMDRVHKCCWIAGHVKAWHKKTTLEGDDAFYCTSNKFLKVMTNAKVVSEDVKMKGLKL